MLLSWAAVGRRHVCVVRPENNLEGDSLAGVPGALQRSLFVSILAVTGCVALLLFAAGLVKAEQMVASWYGPGFEGATTASGEPFDPSDYTAAHRTLPFGTKLIVTLDGRSVVVRVNDRGPYVAGRDLDLSQAAAQHIGLTAVGVATVNVTTANPSAPTGPFVRGAPAPRPEPQPAPQQAPRPAPELAPEPAPEGPAAGAGDAGRGLGDATTTQYGRERPAGTTQYGGERPAGEAQYAGVNQYAGADQYGAQGPVEGGVAPQEAAPEVEPPAPRPAQLETPPAELATPGSTVERRIHLGLADPPEGYTGPLPGDPIEVPEPETPVAPRSSTPDATGWSGGPGGISVLPDTGGASPVTLAWGAVLIYLGTLVLRSLRR
jgi:rare lipoprotein A